MQKFKRTRKLNDKIMIFGFLRTSIQISKSRFFLIALFFFSFFTSYYFIASYILQRISFFNLETAFLQAIFHFFSVFILLVSSYAIKKINKIKLVYFCSILNSILIFFLLLTSFDFFILGVMFCMILFVNIGLIATFSIFGEITVPEERGRIAGAIAFVVFPFYFIVNFFLGSNISFIEAILLGFFINLIPILGLLSKLHLDCLELNKKIQIRYFEKRVFALYFIPWIAFSLINSTLANNTAINIKALISDTFFESLITGQIIGVVLGALSGGIIADFLGRRFSLVFSLTFFGFCTALVGIFKNEFIYIIVYFASGLTWGFLFVLYIFVVWGDLSNSRNRLKIYSIGLISYIFSLGFGSILNFSLELFQSALLSVLIIFLLNLPIIFAPELLDSYVLEKIRMKQHMKKMKKLQKKNQG